MKGAPAIYFGKIISKEHFRAYVYGSDGSRKLVNSWDEYQKHMETGLWFAVKETRASRESITCPGTTSPEITLGKKNKAKKKTHETVIESSVEYIDKITENEVVFEVSAANDFSSEEIK